MTKIVIPVIYQKKVNHNRRRIHNEINCLTTCEVDIPEISSDQVEPVANVTTTYGTKQKNYIYIKGHDDILRTPVLYTDSDGEQIQSTIQELNKIIEKITTTLSTQDAKNKNKAVIFLSRLFGYNYKDINDLNNIRTIQSNQIRDVIHSNEADVIKEVQEKASRLCMIDGIIYYCPKLPSVQISPHDFLEGNINFKFFPDFEPDVNIMSPKYEFIPFYEINKLESLSSTLDRHLKINIMDPNFFKKYNNDYIKYLSQSMIAAANYFMPKNNVLQYQTDVLRQALNIKRSIRTLEESTTPDNLHQLIKDIKKYVEHKELSGSSKEKGFLASLKIIEEILPDLNYDHVETLERRGP